VISFYTRFGKNCMDMALALLGLLILMPFFIVVALGVGLTSRGPAFFRQVRVGRFGKPFQILKFRTMRLAATRDGGLLTAKGDPRVTPIGKLLRKTKVDELPQLINVIAGDMSLVGPRPEVPKYVANYTERQKEVLRVKPGITGVTAAAYVNEEELLANHPDKEQFYIATVLPAKLDRDITYCQQITFAGDLRLIWATFAIIWRRVL
jgi:lipopolysaccharide/colanic/teichoic acid biosynthesis glycosyltransferase